MATASGAWSWVRRSVTLYHTRATTGLPNDGLVEEGGGEEEAESSEEAMPATAWSADETMPSCALLALLAMELLLGAVSLSVSRCMLWLRYVSVLR